MPVLLQQGVALGGLKIGGDHFFTHFLHGDFRRPAKLGFSLARVAQQGFDFCGAKVARVDLHDHITHLKRGSFVTFDGFDDGDLFHALAFKTQLDAEMLGTPADELAHAVLHAGGDDEVFRLVLLQHHPLHAHIVFGVTPVAERIDVPHVEALFQPLGDIGEATGDLAGDEGFATARGFVVEEDELHAYMP